MSKQPAVITCDKCHTVMPYEFFYVVDVNGENRADVCRECWEKGWPEFKKNMPHFIGTKYDPATWGVVE